MAKTSNEYRKFNKAMDSILRADPKAVKGAMEADKQANAEKRKAKRDNDLSEVRTHGVAGQRISAAPKGKR
jgi:hypothetical protein